jgi:Ca2+-binding RTX toxin-like protein
MAIINRSGANGRVSIDGTTFNDTIFGGRFDDNIAGGQGNDEIHGGDGNDFIHEFAFNFPFGIHTGGNDTFFGGGGDDILEGLDGNDFLDGGDDDDEIRGGTGDDTLIGGDGDDLLTETRLDDANNGDDDLRGGAGFDTLRSGVGDDTLDGGADDDSLNGGSGADLMFGGAGADVIDGGDLSANAFDSLVVLGGMSRATADALIAQLNAGDTAAYNLLVGPIDIDLERTVQIGGHAEGDRLIGIENVRGTLRADVLRGDDKANVLEGGIGSDTLEGRGGADVLNGGTGGVSGDPGLDTVSYASSGAAVNVDLLRATQQGADAQGDTLVSIENVTGTRFGDQLRGDDLNNVFDAGFGNDFIDGRGGSDTIDLRAWDAQPFTIAPQIGVLLRDIGDGIATRSTFVNVQTGFGIAETDTLRGIENVIGTNNRDHMTGNSASNRFEGGAGADTMFGAGGDDTIFGGSENDFIDGGVGVDSLLGDGGDDTLLGFDNDDNLDGGDGRDVLNGGKGRDVMNGGVGDDILLDGGEDADVINGGIGNDFIVGGDGDDIRLSGDGDNDTIYGAQGADFMLGGSGADVFEFRSPTEGGDTIGDFASGIDKLFFGIAQFGTQVTFVAGAQPVPNSFFPTLLYNTTTGVLSFDVDGIIPGAPKVIATLTGAPNLAASDLIFG